MHTKQSAAHWFCLHVAAGILGDRRVLSKSQCCGCLGHDCLRVCAKHKTERPNVTALIKLGNNKMSCPACDAIFMFQPPAKEVKGFGKDLKSFFEDKNN